MPRIMSIETFLRKYRDGRPGVKYEYNNGVIEKTESHMKMKEYYIIKNLRRFFDTTTAYQKGGGMECEMEVWTSKTQEMLQWRRPDLSYINPSQDILAFEGKEPIPEFIIEVISPTDNAIIIEDKVYEYFRAGVKILWHIFPHNKTVKIYRSPKQIEVCTDDDLCSAEPVVEGFVLTANDIFKQPV